MQRAPAAVPGSVSAVNPEVTSSVLAEDDEPLCGAVVCVGVMPVQFAHVRGARAVGERRLLLAILEDAVRCFRTNLFARDRRGRALFREAERWIASEDRTFYFSFENICELLAVDARSVRCGLQCWRERQLRRAGRFSAST